MILKQDQVTQRHVYWFAFIFWKQNKSGQSKLYTCEFMRYHDIEWNSNMVESFRVPLIMWSDEHPDTPSDLRGFSNKIDELISWMINDAEQRPTILPMSSFVSSNSAAIWRGPNDTQLYKDLHFP